MPDTICLTSTVTVRGGLRARGMPLGLMPRMSYHEKETTLLADEAALLYSDGLVEAHDPKGEMFGFPRLRALLPSTVRSREPWGSSLWRSSTPL